MDKADEPFTYEIPVLRPDGSKSTTRCVHPDAVAYNIELNLPRGARKDGGLLVSPRQYRVGDIVNLPADPAGQASPGSGYLWKVTAVADDPPSLSFEFRDGPLSSARARELSAQFAVAPPKFRRTISAASDRWIGRLCLGSVQNTGADERLGL